VVDARRAGLEEKVLRTGGRIEPVHRGILAVDIEGFGRVERSDADRAGMRAQLCRLLSQGLICAGIGVGQVTRSVHGDGVLVLVDPRVSKARLLHPLLPRVALGLDRYNRSVVSAMRLRLRAVVHAGEVLGDRYGYTGAALNTAFRLLDAEVLRNVRATSSASVVLLVSDVIYQDIVRPGYGLIDPAGYRPVWVESKETRTRAWLQVPDRADRATDLRAV
jgi:hypothetical protein